MPARPFDHPAVGPGVVEYHGVAVTLVLHDDASVQLGKGTRVGRANETVGAKG